MSTFLLIRGAGSERNRGDSKKDLPCPGVALGLRQPGASEAGHGWGSWAFPGAECSRWGPSVLPVPGPHLTAWCHLRWVSGWHPACPVSALVGVSICWASVDTLPSSASPGPLPWFCLKIPNQTPRLWP